MSCIKENIDIVISLQYPGPELRFYHLKLRLILLLNHINRVKYVDEDFIKKSKVVYLITSYILMVLKRNNEIEVSRSFGV